MTKINNNLIKIIGIILLFNSCAFKKNYIYFNSSSLNEESSFNYDPILKTGDILSINIFSSIPESTLPFNLPSTNSNVRPSYSNGIAASPGYLINQNGLIDLPIIGQLKIVNLTTSETSEIIKEKLKVFITDPIVSVKIENFKITVLGEVKSPGTFQIPNERITLLEALGLAGDLTIMAQRKDILVVRDIDGLKTEYQIDLTTKEIFNSPAYYLSQNDVVYIKPNQAKINSSTVSSSYGMFISVVSLLITTINVLTN